VIPRQLLVTTAILLAVAVGASIYVMHLRNREAAGPVHLRETEHVTPPSVGPTEDVRVWVAHDDSGTLRSQPMVVFSASGQQQHAEELLRGLLKIYTAAGSPHRMGAGAEVRGVYLVDRGLAVVDVNSDFADEQTSGVLPEELTIVSVIQTLTTNIPGILRVKFLVDGKERDTLAGHADLSDIYDVSQFSELAKTLVQEQ
jgi:spore germination protein GerM